MADQPGEEREADDGRCVCGAFFAHRDGCPVVASVVPVSGEEACHCGEPVYTHDDGFTRGLCRSCDTYRCDTADGSCGPVSGETVEYAVQCADGIVREGGRYPFRPQGSLAVFSGAHLVGYGNGGAGPAILCRGPHRVVQRQVTGWVPVDE